jgi:hypothetical protein
MTEAEWAEGASRHLKAELKRAGITYDGLANLLKRQGLGMKREPAFQVSSQAENLRQHFSSPPYLQSDARPSDWAISKQVISDKVIQRQRQTVSALRAAR